MIYVTIQLDIFPNGQHFLFIKEILILILVIVFFCDLKELA